MTKTKRKRGVVLTPEGLEKLLEARLKSENEENEGVRYTLEQLSERTGLDLHTIKRVLACEEGVDLRTLERLYISFNLKLTNSFYTIPNPNKRQDWGEAICTSRFYGRIEELKILEKWLIQDRCRLVTILGIGGVGKTCLSVKLAEQVQNQFDCVIWRSLRDAPPLNCILNDLIQFLSSEQESITDIADSPKEQITRLIKWLRASRCLIVLDNLESLLQHKTRAGQYRDNYQEYANLFKRVGESDHQSCVLLTTREKTREIASLEGKVMPVRTLRLRGVKNEEGTEILKTKGVQGSESQFAQLTKRYAGNALALKVVATTIQDLFGGNISLFLQEDTAIFGDLRDLLEQHFARLSDLEKQIMC